MIVKNGGNQFRECLRSAKPVVNEIVVGDTGSSDNTIEIAKEFGAKILIVPWEDDFSKARNTVLRQCTSEWILQLDADERLITRDPSVFCRLLQRTDAYGFTVQIESNVSKTGWVAVSSGLRLFRNNADVYYEGVVHEQVTNSIQRLNKNIYKSPVRIAHCGYSDNNTNVTKAERNVALMKKDIELYGADVAKLLHLGMGLITLKQYDEAKNILEQVATYQDNIVRALAFSMLGQIANDEQRFGDVLYYAEQSLNLVPVQYYARKMKAFALLSSKDYVQALQVLCELQTLLEKNVSNKDLFYDSIPSPIEVDEFIAVCKAELGRYDEAFDDFICMFNKYLNVPSTVFAHLNKLVPLVELNDKRLRNTEKVIKKRQDQAFSLLILWIELLCASKNYQKAESEAIKYKIPKEIFINIKLRWLLEEGLLDEAYNLVSRK